MKLRCRVCNKEFKYPFEQIKHRHEDLELDLVPPNFWDIIEEDTDEKNPRSSLLQYPFAKESYNISLKVGNTRLFRYLSNKDNINNNLVYLKDESTNPTGSFKDRGMDNLMNDVRHSGKKQIAVVSCGSGAIAVVNFAKEYGIKSHVFIHKNVEKSSLKAIEKADKIHFSETFISSYEDYLKYSLKHIDDCYFGFLNTNVAYMLGLGSMSYEIIRDLRQVPDVILIPCGSGMDIVAQNFALRQMYKNGIIDKIPKIGIVELKGGNPIETGYQKGEKGWLFIIDSPVDSKTILSNDTCFNYKKIVDMVDRDEAFFLSVSDEEIDKFIEQDKDDFVNRYDYTSLSVMAALNKYLPSQKNKTIVAVLTCKNRLEVKNYYEGKEE